MKRTETQEERNEKIIRAVKEKAEAVCPGSLDLIGINGSFVTGQQHARSDLDLLIVIGESLLVFTSPKKTSSHPVKSNAPNKQNFSFLSFTICYFNCFPL